MEESLITYWGKELLSTGIVLPIIWYLLREQKRIQAEYNTAIQEGFKNITIAMGKHIPASNDLLIETATNYVWAASDSKLDYIQQRIEKNNLTERREQIEKDIKAKLIKISNDKYVVPLNAYYIPQLRMPLGERISENFPMDDFLAEVYDVVFRDDIDVHRKRNDIKTVMQAYQNTLWYDLKNKLNG